MKTFGRSILFVTAFAAGVSNLAAVSSQPGLALSLSGQQSNALPGQSSRGANLKRTPCEFNHGRLVRCGSGERTFTPGIEQGLVGRADSHGRNLATSRCEFNHGRLVKCASDEKAR